jgi:hypothetical protein
MVYAFATRAPRKLRWRYIEALDESAALKRARKIVGPDVDIYAGPIPEKCQFRDCDHHAVRLGGHGAWCPLCQKHLDGPFPAHFQLK